MSNPVQHKERSSRLVTGFLSASLIVTAVAGCSSSTSPGSLDEVTVDVHVTGGFVGNDYSYRVHGDGRVLGVTCVSGCDFDAGDLLVHLTGDQVEQLLMDVRSADIPSINETNYGHPCCDLIGVSITVRDGSRRGTISGATSEFPDSIAPVVRQLLGLGNGATPIVVSLNGGSFPRDQISLDSASLSGSHLLTTVSFGGGCERHDVALVANNGWMESNPVQVGVIVSHEDNDDPCDAYLTEHRQFNLEPLALAYRHAYPGTAVGDGQLILRLQDPSQPDSLLTFLYQF